MRLETKTKNVILCLMLVVVMLIAGCSKTEPAKNTNENVSQQTTSETAPIVPDDYTLKNDLELAEGVQIKVPDWKLYDQGFSKIIAGNNHIIIVTVCYKGEETTSLVNAHKIACEHMIQNAQIYLPKEAKVLSIDKSDTETVGYTDTYHFTGSLCSSESEEDKFFVDGYSFLVGNMPANISCVTRNAGAVSSIKNKTRSLMEEIMSTTCSPKAE